MSNDCFGNDPLGEDTAELDGVNLSAGKHKVLKLYDNPRLVFNREGSLLHLFNHKQAVTRLASVRV